LRGDHSEWRTTTSAAKRLQAHYFLLFAPFAIATTYQNLHFKRLGFSNSQIGTLGAVGAILMVVSPPLWGYVADRLGDQRRPLALLLLASGATYPLFLLTRSFVAAAVAQVLFSCFYAPCIALTDALVLGQLEGAGGDYGRLRLWGSVGFICALLAFGLFLGGGPLAPRGAGASLTLTFVAFVAIRVANAAWLLLVPGERVQVRPTGYRRDYGQLLRDRAFLLFLLSALVSTAALRAYYVFFSIYLDGLGVADSLKGAFWSLGVAAEVVFMLFAGRVLRRIGMRRMLLLGMAGGALRLLLFSFALPLGVVALAQLLHALAFAAVHIAAMAFITASVPDRLRASGQAAYAAVVGGVGGTAGSRLAGDLSQGFGIPYAFRACAFVAGAAVLLAAFLPERKPAPER